MVTQTQYAQIVAANNAAGVSTPTIGVLNGIGIPSAPPSNQTMPGAVNTGSVQNPGQTIINGVLQPTPYLTPAQQANPAVPIPAAELAQLYAQYGIKPTVPTAPVAITPTNNLTYTVNPGDNLSTIAAKLGVKASSITGYKSGNPNLIYPGEVLQVPSPATGNPTGVNAGTATAGTTPTAPADGTGLKYPDLSNLSGDPASILASLSAFYGANDPATQKLQDQQNSIIADITAEMDKLTGKATETKTLQDNAGIPAMQKDIQELTNQLTLLTADSQTAQLANQGKGMPMGLVTGRNSRIDRDTAVQSLIISAQIQAKTGSLNLAMSQITQAIDLKYSGIETDLANKKTLLDINNSQLSASQKKQADALDKYWTLQQNAITDKKNEETDIKNIALKIAANGASNAVVNSVMNATSLSDAMDKASKSGKLNEVKAATAPKATVAPTVKSGALVVSGAIISAIQNALDITRSPVNNGYADTQKYLDGLKNWQLDGGLPPDYFKEFPPKDYLLSTDPLIPTYIKNKLGSTDGNLF